MPHFDYECSKCGFVQEEFHFMTERPLVHCYKCRGACIKLIGSGSQIMGMDAGRATYDFVDFNTTGKPVQINSKRQWKEHLKSHGLHDDVSNTPMKTHQLKEGMLNVDKEKIKRETKKAIVEAVKDKKFKAEVKQKIKKELYAARNK